MISALEETLPKDSFIRIHRSFIIATNKIDSYNADSIQIGNKELPISRLFKQNVNKLLGISSLSSSNGSKGIKKEM